MLPPPVNGKLFYIQGQFLSVFVLRILSLLVLNPLYHTKVYLRTTFNHMEFPLRRCFEKTEYYTGY